MEVIRMDKLIIHAYRKRDLCRVLKRSVKGLEKRTAISPAIQNDAEGRKFLKTILEANGYCVVESIRLPAGVIAIHPSDSTTVHFFVVKVFRDIPPQYPDEEATRLFHRFVLYASGFMRASITRNRKITSTAHWIIIITSGDRIVKVEDAFSTGVFLR